MLTTVQKWVWCQTNSDDDSPLRGIIDFFVTNRLFRFKGIKSDDVVDPHE